MPLIFALFLYRFFCHIHNLPPLTPSPQHLTYTNNLNAHIRKYYKDIAAFIQYKNVYKVSAFQWSVHFSQFNQNIRYWNKKFWEELIAYFSWYDKGHIENDASNNSSNAACVFVTAVTFLPSCRLATIEGFYRTVA
jgi:hypothetical protein